MLLKNLQTNLLNEGVSKDKIYFVGNLMIDSLRFGLKKISSIKNNINHDFGLVTLHRPSNVDNIKVFKDILSALDEISRELVLYFLFTPEPKKL